MGRTSPDLLDEQADHPRVELGGGAAFELRARLLDAHALSVGAVGGHRGEAVGHAHHASLERDLLAPQARRVAGAVVALVVVKDRCRHRAQGGYLLDDAVADPRMQLHDPALLGGQAAGLEQDAFADADLAHVVQQRGEHELLAPARSQVQPVGDSGHVVRDLVGVRAQEGVLGLDGVGQHAHRREVRGAQLALQAAVVQCGPGVVAEGQQHIVLQLLESALAVRADDDAGEVVPDVDRDRDQVLDLLVGAGALAVELVAGVLAHGLVALRSPSRQSAGTRRCARGRSRSRGSRRGRGRRPRLRRPGRAAGPSRPPPGRWPP